MAGKYVAPTYERIEKTDSKGHFFVRLAYGVVGSYKDTSSMTTTEVIEEFLDRNGVRTPREFFEKKFKGGNKPEQEQKPESSEKKELSDEGKTIVSELESIKVRYNEVKKWETQPNETEIISHLAGGDMTKGSCSSLAFAYIGNKNGYDVLDFRDGESRGYFATVREIRKMVNLPGVEGQEIEKKYEISGGLEVLKSLDLNEEYYFTVGKHATIVRRTESDLEYLELQSNQEGRNGWRSFKDYGSAQDTLYYRFGCRKTPKTIKIGDRKITFPAKIFVAKVSAYKDSADFKKILGYINTEPENQRKGKQGNVK